MAKPKPPRRKPAETALRSARATTGAHLTKAPVKARAKDPVSPGPFVFSNLATSVDGKIATVSRAPFMLGTKRDRAQMDVLRQRADVVMMGAETLRTHRRACVPKADPGKHADRSARAAAAVPANAIVSRKLEGIDPEWPFFKHPTMRRILFVSRETPPGTLAKFQESCEIVFLEGETDGFAANSKAERRDPPSVQPVGTGRFVLRSLIERGLSRVLIEGGGGLMWDFVREDLIDEYYVTLTPWMIGGLRAPTLVDGEGFDPTRALKLRLKSVKRVGNELYLVYTS